MKTTLGYLMSHSCLGVENSVYILAIPCGAGADQMKEKVRLRCDLSGGVTFVSGAEGASDRE